MIKSNTKKFKEKVQQYIIECMEDGEHDRRECLQIASEDFNVWYCEYNRRQYPTIVHALWRYLYEGNTSISVYYAEQRDLLKEWYEQTDKEASKYDDTRVANIFHYHAAKNLLALCKKYNIKVKD